jgi:TfoX/Sxy family transcriptional regulator of competence genes
MFSILHADGVLGLRLPENEREKFLEKHAASLVQKYGIVQKEYVAVSDKVLNDAKAMKKYFGISYEYAKTLKPKPTTKSKK